MKKFSLVLPLKIRSYNWLLPQPGSMEMLLMDKLTDIYEETENQTVKDICLKVFSSNDLERLTKIQLPTFSKFLDMSSVDKFYIICLSDELNEVKLKLTQEFPEFPFEFLTEEQVCPKISLLEKDPVNNDYKAPPHLKQQLLKFGISKIVKTEHYLLLDADVFLTKRFTYDNLFRNDKVIFTSLQQGTPQKPHGVKFWENSISFLFNGMEQKVKKVSFQKTGLPSGVYGEVLKIRESISVTPEIFITEKVKELIEYIENKYNMSYIESLLKYAAADVDGSRNWSEYSLYWVFLAHEFDLEALYSFDGPGLFGNELWRITEDAAMERTLKDYYKRLDLVFEHKEIADWCWNPSSDYYFSLVQSNIRQLDLKLLEHRIKEIIK